MDLLRQVVEDFAQRIGATFEPATHNESWRVEWTEARIARILIFDQLDGAIRIFMRAHAGDDRGFYRMTRLFAEFGAVDEITDERLDAARETLDSWTLGEMLYRTY